MPTNSIKVVAASCFACATLASPPAAAQLAIGSGLFPNLVGAGVGVTPRYSGASENVGGVAPAFRYQFKDSERYVEWYGTLADANLLESASWQFGPVLNLRFGRKDVEDAVVRLLDPVDNTVEGGLMLSYAWTKTQGVPWRLRVGAFSLLDLGDVYSGVNTTAFASFWMPLSHKVFLGLGGGLTWSSSSYNRAFYGITDRESQASGLPAYTPGSGMRQWYAWPALIFEVAPSWYMGTGVFYQRVSGEAADSPIVAQRGDRNQWTGGVGLAYVWK